MNNYDHMDIDIDPDDGRTIDCVVCGHRPQRGGTGCCSQECADAEEYADALDYANEIEPETK